MTRFSKPHLTAGVALLGALLSGCVSELPPPDVDRVSPDRLYFADDVPLTIHGANFYPGVDADAQRNTWTLDDAFTVELVDQSGAVVPLLGVEFVDYQTLTALYPAGHPVGTYDLRVTGPEGGEGVLEDALYVADSWATGMIVTAEQSAVSVGTQVPFSLQLADAQGDPIAEERRVQVEVETLSGAPSLEWVAPIGLSDVEWVSEDTLIGSLGRQGEGTVTLSAHAAGVVRLRVSTPDDPFIDAGFAQVAFNPGSLEEVRVQVADDLVAIAGQPFEVRLTPLDSEGVVIDDEDVVVSLSDVCLGGVTPDSVTLRGEQSAGVLFVRATNPSGSCSTTQLRVSGGASGPWDSAPFVVRAGAPEELVVRYPDGESLVEAGVAQLVELEVRDSLGNVVSDFSGTPDFSTRVGPGVVDATVEQVSPWVGGRSLWEYAPTTAGVSILDVDLDGLVGEAPQIEVFASAPVQLQGGTDSAVVAAGDPVGVWVELQDRFGNAVVFDPTQDELQVAHAGETLSCVSFGDDGTRSTFSCAPTVAATVALELRYDPEGLVGSTDTLEITNGTLTTVGLTGPGSVSAGASFSLAAIGRDAFGNPYTVGDPQVGLSDGSGTLSPSSLTLGADGTATVGGFTITHAGMATVLASRSGSGLGTVSIEVEPGELDDLEVSLDPSWVWLGEPAQVVVSGIDAYGNAVPDYTGPVTLSSSSGLFLSDVVTEFSGGMASVDVTWDTAGLRDRVVAQDDDGLLASSGQVDALDADCTDPPVADLSLAGSDDAVACIRSGVASVAFSAAGSTAGASALSAYHVLDQGTSTRSTSATGTLSYASAGSSLVTLVVADAAACGAETQGIVWRASPGLVAGPLDVSLADSSRLAGGNSTTSDSTVTLTGTDCEGATPASTQVYVRTDLGVVQGVSSASDGLYVTLSSGAASLTWSGQSLVDNGTATVVAGTSDGSAYGTDTLLVTGETGPPHVAWIDPRGSTSELLDTISVGFSEPMLSSSLTSSTVTVSGPNGALGASPSLSADGLELTITLDDTTDSSSGTYTVGLSAGVRDENSNRLDGDWTGGNNAFSSVFGDVGSDGLSVTSCVADTSQLVPDGNSGSGSQADRVVLAAVASGTPDMWLVEVSDDTGERVRTRHVAATSASQSLSWGARDDLGRVVDDGVYTVQVSTVDSHDTLSTACSTQITVSQHIVGPQ